MSRTDKAIKLLQLPSSHDMLSVLQAHNALGSRYIKICVTCVVSYQKERENRLCLQCGREQCFVRRRRDEVR